jgi:uncharacterized protein YraI
LKAVTALGDIRTSGARTLSGVALPDASVLAPQELRIHVVRFATLLCLTLATTAARAQDTTSLRDTVAYTTTIVTVRAKPFANSEALGRVDAVVPVHLYTCSVGWCSIATTRLSGYVLQEYLSSQPTPVTQRAGRGYINSRGEWVPSPTSTPNDSQPVGASARCRDGTYSFSRSRRGTCSHHGGVGAWLH